MEKGMLLKNRKLIGFILAILLLLPTKVLAQAVGGQVTRPVKKQQNTQQTRNKPTNSSPKKKIFREVSYESTLSAKERKVWNEEKGKAKETMRLLANSLKSQGLEISGNFNDGMARCRKKDKSFCFINKLGEILFTLSPSISSVRGFHNGYAVITQKNRDNSEKEGVIDKSGRIVVNAEYDWIENFSEGLFRARRDKKCGFINKNGDVIIPFVYEFAFDFHEGLAAVKKEGKCGFVDKSNNTVIPFEYDDNLDFSEGLAPVKKNEEWGYINKSNTLIIPYSYWYARPFQSGLGQVIIENTDRDIARTGVLVQSGYINKQGKYVIPLRRGNLSDFSDDLIEIKGSYLDKNGNVIIRTKYDQCCYFSEGLAFVGKIYKTKPEYYYKYGVINKKGQIVIDFKFIGQADFNAKFRDGLALIWDSVKGPGFVDKYGNSTFDFE